MARSDELDQLDQLGRDRRRPRFDPIGRIVDTIVPTVTHAVDVDDVVRRIDVDDIVRRIDIPSVLARIDFDALVARVDVDALLERVDVNSLLADIDLDALLDHVDVNALVARVDLDALLARVAVNEMLDRVDVDRLAARIDVAAVVERVDVDAVVDRVDIDRVMQRADLAGLVADSTRGITARTLDLVRRQVAGIDAIITRLAARLMHRDPVTDSDGPTTLVDLPQPDAREASRPSITGHYAGPVARTAAVTLDWMTMVFVFGLFTALANWIVDVLVGNDGSHLAIDPLWSTVAFGAWAFVYFAIPMALTGRTFGKGVVGLRVVRRDGAPLRLEQALIRVLVLPISFLALGLGLVGAVFGRHRRTLHDLAAGSVEVIDWGDRPAALPTPLSNWLARRQTGADAQDGQGSDRVG